MMEPANCLVLLTAYVLGCLNAGYYWVRYRASIDIRDLGSGNAGARNVGRLLGTSGFATVFIFDALKGVVAVMLGIHFGSAWPIPELSALAVVLGHVFPIQLGFRGGKGIATALGALLAMQANAETAGLTFAIPALIVLLLWTHRENIRAFWKHRH